MRLTRSNAAINPLARVSALVLLVHGMVGCKQSAREQSDTKPILPASASSARPLPPKPLMPGQTVPLDAPEETAAPQTVHAQETVPAPTTIKSSGKVGEQLEGSHYFFKLHSFRLCGAALNDASRARAFGKEQGGVVGAEVEIKAKERLNISPKDVRLNRGGIIFDTSIDLKRSFKGCSPLLQFSQIGRDEVAKGFVLFDIPESEANRQDLTLHYLPTRWGGAGTVTVQLGSFHEPH